MRFQLLGPDFPQLFLNLVSSKLVFKNMYQYTGPIPPSPPPPATSLPIQQGGVANDYLKLTGPACIATINSSLQQLPLPWLQQNVERKYIAERLIKLI